MSTKLLTGILFAALASAVAARPQNTEATGPSNGVVAPAAPAPEVSGSAAVAPAGAVTNAVTQIVYSPTLPAVADLKAAAEAQGLKLERVVQTQIQVIAFFRNAQGQETTVAYQSTPPTGAAAPASTVVATQPAVVAAPPQVVYQTAPQVVYADAPYYPYYYGYPRPVYAAPYYPPVSLSLGFVFGSRGGYYGGHYHWR